jgi:hypothetical protein
MRRVLITVFIAIAASAALWLPAASATPAPPSQLPYEGCSDWYVQTSYPMSEDDPQWVFRCSAGNISWEEGTGWWGASDYYWNADSSQVVHFADYFVDLDEGFFWSCVLYPSGSGACGD